MLDTLIIATEIVPTVHLTMDTDMEDGITVVLIKVAAKRAAIAVPMAIAIWIDLKISKRLLFGGYKNGQQKNLQQAWT